MIIERFKNGDALPVYRRFREHGRLAPEGLEYVSSWVDEKLEMCFQLMEASNISYVNEWIANWSDIVEFEVYPVISSKQAADRVWPDGS
jgi:plasmid replication initiation protein